MAVPHHFHPVQATLLLNSTLTTALTLTYSGLNGGEVEGSTGKCLASDDEKRESKMKKGNDESTTVHTREEEKRRLLRHDEHSGHC